MGAYAAWFSGLFDADLRMGAPGAKPAATVPLDRTLLVADFEPPAALIHNFLGGVPRWLALPSPPQRPLPGVGYGCFRTGSNPIWFDESLQDAFRRGDVEVVAFLCPPSAIHGQTLLSLAERGVRHVIYPTRRRNRCVAPKRLAYEKLLTNAPKRILSRLGWRTERTMTLAQCQNLIASAPSPPGTPGGEGWGEGGQHPARRLQRHGDGSLSSRGILSPSPPTPGPRSTGGEGSLKIAHFICALNSGGAERQVCYAAIGQKKLGHDVRVFCRQSPVGVDGHYLSLLEPHGIPARRIGSQWSADFVANLQTRRPPSIDSLPPDLRQTVADTLGELLAWQPDVLHCYVDDCNVPGAIAGVLARTPAIMVSFRNGNPSLFPGLEMPWMKPWYQSLRGHPRVRFSSNSAGGARDYENWLGWPNETPVIRNAFEPPPVPCAAEANAWRTQVGIAADAPLVAGVFRLQEEKRPLYFLDCIAKLRTTVPDVRVVVAGVGELERPMRDRIQALGLDGVVQMLGQRSDVPTILAASDVLLLTSSWEGTPNVALEAQHCGCVPVLTDVGGSAEAVDPGSSGILVGRDDLEGTVAVVAQLLRDPARRQAMSAAGRHFVQANFSPEALTVANLRAYRAILAQTSALRASA